MTAIPLARRLLILVVLVSAGLSGCAVGAGAPKEPAYRVVNGATYVPVSTADLEFSREAATLKLPPSGTWPRQRFAKTGSGMPEWYQVGYGRQAADRYWFCSWASVAVNAPNAQVRRDSIDTLQRMMSLYYYTDALDPPSQPQLVTELKTAERGNLTALRNDLHLNC